MTSFDELIRTFAPLKIDEDTIMHFKLNYALTKLEQIEE